MADKGLDILASFLDLEMITSTQKLMCLSLVHLSNMTSEPIGLIDSGNHSYFCTKS
jgi:hypothetical protein